jgi:hypothetical protein
VSVLLMLRCDHDQDGLCGAQLLTAHASPGEARSWAALQGWTQRCEQDFCPGHDPDPPPRPRIAPLDLNPG